LLSALLADTDVPTTQAMGSGLCAVRLTCYWLAEWACQRGLAYRAATWT